MKSYSEREVFESHEIALLARATKLVANVDGSRFAFEIRCHELARAVGRIVRLNHEDGKYSVLPESGGGIEHSWLLVPRSATTAYLRAPSILDVYAVGRQPQVQLLASTLTVPHHRQFLPGLERDDVKDQRVLLLMQAMIERDDITLDDVDSKYPKMFDAMRIARCIL